MSRRAFLRTIAGLDNEETSRLTEDDWLVCQVDGETFPRKINPALAIPNDSVGTDQLKSNVPLFSKDAVTALPTLGATIDAGTDTLIVSDFSNSGALKRVYSSQLIPDNSLYDAKINSSANIDRSKFAGYFPAVQTNTSDIGNLFTYYSSFRQYSFSFTLPRTGNYLVMVVLSGQAGANADSIVYLDGQIKDLNGTIRCADTRIVGADGASGFAKVTTGSATMAATCNATAGSKTVVAQAKYTAVVGSPSGNNMLTGCHALVLSL